jgi:hypothetical protein
MVIITASQNSQQRVHKRGICTIFENIRFNVYGALSDESFSSNYIQLSDTCSVVARNSGFHGIFSGEQICRPVIYERNATILELIARINEGPTVFLICNSN